MTERMRFALEHWWLMLPLLLFCVFGQMQALGVLFLVLTGLFLLTNIKNSATIALASTPISLFVNIILTAYF